MSHCTWGRATSRAILVAVLLALTSHSRANSLTLTLAPETSLATVKNGDDVTFDVVVSGIGTPLDSLFATIEFDPTQFDTPSSIAPGAIVPDIAGFLSGPAAGIADASYFAAFSSTNAPIASDGVFFSFTIKAIGSGTGTIDFKFTDAFDTTFNEIVPLSNTLQYTIPAADDASAVPLPSIAVAGLFCFNILGGGIALRTRSGRYAIH